MRYLLMALCLVVVTGGGVKSPTSDFIHSVKDFNNSIKELRNVQIINSADTLNRVRIEKESK